MKKFRFDVCPKPPVDGNDEGITFVVELPTGDFQRAMQLVNRYFGEDSKLMYMGLTQEPQEQKAQELHIHVQGLHGSSVENLVREINKAVTRKGARRL